MISITTTSDMMTQEKHQASTEYTITAKNLHYKSVFENDIRAILPGELIYIRFTDTNGQIAGYVKKVLEYFCNKEQTEILRLKLEFTIFVPEKEETSFQYTIMPGLSIARVLRYKDMLAVYFTGDAREIFNNPELLRTEFTEKYSMISYLGTMYHAVKTIDDTGHCSSILGMFSYAQSISDTGEGTQYCSNGIVVYYTSNSVYSESTYQTLKDFVKKSIP